MSYWQTEHDRHNVWWTDKRQTKEKWSLYFSLLLHVTQKSVIRTYLVSVITVPVHSVSRKSCENSSMAATSLLVSLETSRTSSSITSQNISLAVSFISCKNIIVNHKYLRSARVPFYLCLFYTLKKDIRKALDAFFSVFLQLCIFKVYFLREVMICI